VLVMCVSVDVEMHAMLGLRSWNRGMRTGEMVQLVCRYGHLGKDRSARKKNGRCHYEKLIQDRGLQRRPLVFDFGASIGGQWSKEHASTLRGLKMWWSCGCVRSRNHATNELSRSFVRRKRVERGLSRWDECFVGIRRVFLLGEGGG